MKKFIYCVLLFTFGSVFAQQAEADKFSSIMEAADGTVIQQNSKNKKNREPEEILVDLVMPHWKEYYEKSFKNRYPEVPEKVLRESGFRTFHALYPIPGDNNEPLFAMVLLNWRAKMMGLEQELIDDATEYSQDAASMFAVRWYEFQLILMDRQRRGIESMTLTDKEFKIQGVVDKKN